MKKATYKVRYALLAPLVLLLVALAACGGASAPAAAPLNSETMTNDSMEQSGDALTEDSMEKTGDAMTENSMEQTDEAMTENSMDQTDEAMTQDSMEKSDEAMTEDSMDQTDEAMTMSMNVLVLDFAGIEPLANGFHYEGWTIVGGVPVTTGKFNVNSSGELVDLSGGIIAGGAFRTPIDLSSATAVVITIEPDGDIDGIPADTHYVSGSVTNGSADLTIGHGAALGSHFSDASGVYILATPTDGPDTNENSGIWFLDLSSGSPAQGLNLPLLPAGWEYEGWAVIGGIPVSTGRFNTSTEADLDLVFSGPLSGPPFPGEDFLVNAPDGLTFPVDLAGGAAVISVEPVPDDSAAPFTLKPLVGTIPEDATDHTVYPLENKASGFPGGTARIMADPVGK